MAVIVTTSGPISGLPDIILPKDRTFSDLISEIADEIDDTTNEYNSQIQTAIRNAIKFCEREPYYFNESLTFSFKTIAGKYIYSEKDNPKIATAAGITHIYLLDNGNPYELRKRLPEDLEIFYHTNSGDSRPIFYSYFSREIRLYPIPDGIYTIQMQLEPMRYNPISAPDEVSPWFTEAYGLIRARAKYELYKNIIKDNNMVTISFNDFREEQAALKAETSRRNGTGIIRGTYF